MRELSGRKKNSGAVTLIEATMVFPIVFLLMFLIIFLGGYYYTTAYMTRVANKAAIMATEYLKNEQIYYIDATGKFAAGRNTNMYQQIGSIFGGGIKDNIKKSLEQYVKDSVNSSANTVLGFTAVEVKKKLGDDKYVNISPGFFGTDVDVVIEYSVAPGFSTRLLGGTFMMDCAVKAHAEVTDTTEFIRNVDMLEDFYIDFSKTKLGQKVTSSLDKLKGNINKMVSNVKRLFKK